jgi:hypothetical protein
VRAVVTLRVVTAACDEPKPLEADLQASIRREIEEGSRRVMEQKDDWADRLKLRI